MGRGDFRERTRESQKKKKERDERKKRATELARLEEGGEHRTGTFGQFKHGKDSAAHKQRRKHLKSKLKIGDKPLKIKDHLDRDSSVGAEKRKEVRKNPVSEETLLKVRKQVDTNKAKGESGEVKKTDSSVAAEENKKTITPSTAKPSRKEKRDKKNFPGGKEGYTRQERAGARQSSARNSVARQAYLRKKAKLKIKKGE